jgi:2-methylcitrate dehydratase
MGMHFKLGLYEHQSAAAIQAMITLLQKSPGLLDDPGGGKIAGIRIVAYEPAYGIIGDPAKRDPKTRQSADHSMVYIIATLLRKALEKKRAGWTQLMLEPADYSPEAIRNPRTRALMEKITFAHGGPDYDRRYPDGIPTSVVIEDSDGKTHDSGLVMYPAGHARNTEAPLEDILEHKFALLGALAFDDPAPVIDRFERLADLTSDEVRSLHNFALQSRGGLE